MFRAILAAVLGYVVMAVLVAALFAAAYTALGADRAFQPGRYDPSTTWLALACAIGFIAAALGGMVAVKVCGARGTKWLIVVVLVLGAIDAAFKLAHMKDIPEVRPGDASISDAMLNARQPSWILIANPIIGVLGVAFGAGLAGRKKG
jgi:hypothetical protein